MARKVESGAAGRLGSVHPLVAALHLRPEPGDVAGNRRLSERAVTAVKAARSRIGR